MQYARYGKILLSSVKKNKKESKKRIKKEILCLKLTKMSMQWKSYLFAIESLEITLKMWIGGKRHGDLQIYHNTWEVEAGRSGI